MTIRRFINSLWIASIGLSLFTTAYSDEKKGNTKEFLFGVIADCQYCNDTGKGVRKYSLSKSKLQKCVTHFNSMDLEYVVHLGDFIDRDFRNFDVLNPIYGELNMPGYHVLGNHDFSVVDGRKKDVAQKLGMPSRYYDFEVSEWRFIVLDGNDISFHAYPQSSEKHKEAAAYYIRNNIQSPKWNGAIGAKQLAWLQTVLEKASKKNENVVLFCHFPIYPENIHNLWNAGEIIEAIEAYSCVKAYISGHNHEGNYGTKAGIHYLTLKGMVDTIESSYGVIGVKDDCMEVTGYGREQSRVLKIRD